MRPESLTHQVERLDKPGVMPGNEPDIGQAIDDPTVGSPADPSHRDPLMPEVDGPSGWLRVPPDWPDALPPPDPIPPRDPAPVPPGLSTASSIG